MTFEEIQDLLKLVSELDLTEFKMRDGDFKLSIRTKHFGTNQQAQAGQQAHPPATMIPVPPVQQNYAQPQVPQAAPASEPSQKPAGEKIQPAEEAEESNYQEIRSPMVGTFYRAPSPDKPPYLKVGDAVEVGSVVCIVEAMKLFNEIESEVSGRVVKVMIEDASPVEYDQVLFLVDPNG